MAYSACLTRCRRYLQRGLLPKAQSGGRRYRVLIPRSALVRLEQPCRKQEIARDGWAEKQKAAEAILAALQAGPNLRLESAPKPPEQVFSVGPNVLLQPVSVLRLDVRSRKCVVKLGVKTLGELASKTAEDIQACRNVGATTLNPRLLPVPDYCSSGNAARRDTAPRLLLLR